MSFNRLVSSYANSFCVSNAFSGEDNVGLWVWISYIHLVVCLTTGPKPLPIRALHIVRSRGSSFNCEYPLLSLRSSSSFLRFLPRLPVTSIPPFIFPSITRCRRQFLRKMWPSQLAFRFLISITIKKYMQRWYCGIACHKNGSNMSQSQRVWYETKIKLAAHSCVLELHSYVQRPNEFSPLEYPLHEASP